MSQEIIDPSAIEGVKPVAQAPSFGARFFQDIAMFFRIGYQFWRGFHFLRKTDKAITIFGSARLADNHRFCEQARQVAFAFAKKDFAIITGGGPSVMQAANQGAFEAGGKSVGINIELPREQNLNRFVNAGLRCHYFFVRKVLLCRYSSAFVIFPGGFGTLDEFFEIITLMQTKKMIERPVILVGKEFWSGLLGWCQQTLIPHGMINEAEFKRLRIVDSAEEAIGELNALTSARP